MSARNTKKTKKDQHQAKTTGQSDRKEGWEKKRDHRKGCGNKVNEVWTMKIEEKGG